MIDLLMAGQSNDLVIQNGDLVLVHNDSAIRQAVQQNLQTFLGEWFLDTTQGVPWLQSILVQHPNLDVIQSVLQEAILSTPGILSLTAFNFSFDNGKRTLTIQFQAISTNGQTIDLETSVGV